MCTPNIIHSVGNKQKTQRFPRLGTFSRAICWACRARMWVSLFSTTDLPAEAPQRWLMMVSCKHLDGASVQSREKCLWVGRPWIQSSLPLKFLSTEQSLLSGAPVINVATATAGSVLKNDWQEGNCLLFHHSLTILRCHSPVKKLLPSHPGHHSVTWLLNVHAFLFTLTQCMLFLDFDILK